MHCGIIGLANLEKRHCGTKTCIEAKAKRDKDAMKKKNGSLLTFFHRPKVSAVPSMIPNSTSVQSYKIAAAKAPNIGSKIPANFQSDGTVTVLQSTSMPTVSTFLDKLQYSIKNIPESVPEAGDNDKLAIFGGDPKGF